MKLLVVDDEEAIRLSLQVFAELDNHECRTAANGREALDMLEDEWVDVLICDLIMPVFSGMELLQEIQVRFADRPEISIIMITGNTDMDDAHQAYDLGAKWVLQKPIRSTVLKDLISSLS